MDLMESPLNRFLPESRYISCVRTGKPRSCAVQGLQLIFQAHLCGRKANRLVAQENYEEAILCHGEAADLLKVALLMTQNEQVKLSLELQRDRHLQQQRLIRDTWKQGKLARKSSICTKQKPLPPTQSPPASQPASPKAIRYVSQETPQGCKAAKDDRTRLEEQSMAIADLRKVVAVLLRENEKLLEENESLKVENARLKRDPYADQQNPHLTPLLNSVEATQGPLPLDLPLLHLPPDLQEEIRLLWERD